jgi:hypothetical protein
LTFDGQHRIPLFVADEVTRLIIIGRSYRQYWEGRFRCGQLVDS